MGNFIGRFCYTSQEVAEPTVESESHEYLAVEDMALRRRILDYLVFTT